MADGFLRRLSGSAPVSAPNGGFQPIARPARRVRDRKKPPRIAPGRLDDADLANYALAAGATEASSTFTPGPIVEEMATRWM